MVGAQNFGWDHEKTADREFGVSAPPARFLLWRNNDVMGGAGLTWSASKILVRTTERMRTASSELVHLLRDFYYGETMMLWEVLV